MPPYASTSCNLPHRLLILAIFPMLLAHAPPIHAQLQSNLLFESSFSRVNPVINNNTACNGKVNGTNLDYDCDSLPQESASSTFIPQCQTRIFTYGYKGLPKIPLVWNFTAESVPATDGNTLFAWNLTGHHSWYRASASVSIISGASDEVELLGNNSVLAGKFTRQGNATLPVKSGRPLQFSVKGFHFDKNLMLQGQLTVFGVQPPTSDSLSASFSDQPNDNGWFNKVVQVNWTWAGPDADNCKTSGCPIVLLNKTTNTSCAVDVTWGPGSTVLELKKTVAVNIDIQPPQLGSGCTNEISIPSRGSSSAPADVTVSLSPTDDVSGINRAKYPGGFALTGIVQKLGSDNVSKSVSGFELGKSVSTGKVRAWPPNQVYTLRFTTEDMAGLSTTCTATIRIGPEASKNLLPALLGAGVSLMVVLLAAGLFYCFYLRHHLQPKQAGRVILDIPDNILHSFLLSELQAATHNFERSSLLGTGGYGAVYKGVLPDGAPIAVKQLNQKNWNLGEDPEKQEETDFQVELRVLGTIHHRNIVKLKGYCIEAGQYLLVYEFMQNGSLEDMLFSKEEEPSMVVTWETVHNILLGVARGLAYLHTECTHKILHRDIKPANILLDESFQAKVGDFGLARTTQPTDTHISTKAGGTRGYWAPELLHGLVTEKADVYSFGVLMLTTISRRPAVSFAPSTRVDSDSLGEPTVKILTQIALQKYHQGQYQKFVSRNYQHVDATQVHRFMSVALNCVLLEPKCRPPMAAVVQMLEGLLEVPEVPLPGTDSDFSHDLQSIGHSCSRSTFWSSFTTTK